MRTRHTITAQRGQLVAKGTLSSVDNFIEQYGLIELLPNCNEIVFEIGNEIPSGKLQLWQAHATWTENWFAKTATPEGFCRQEMDASLPDGLRKLSANCIVERSGGMGSHFGFIGTYVSLLLSLDTNTVWDARSCDAT